MIISNLRIRFEAIATFQPTLPGSLGDRQVGFGPQSFDVDGCDVAHVLRLDVTNFGTNGIVINAATLALTLADGAAATQTGVNGVDADGEDINIASIKVVGIRIVSAAEPDSRVSLSNDEITLFTSGAKAAFIAMGTAVEFSNFTLNGVDAGVLSPATVVEILIAGVSA